MARENLPLPYEILNTQLSIAYIANLITAPRLQWRQLGGLRGRRPQDSQTIFLLDSLIQCSIYVHAYQALVHFST